MENKCKIVQDLLPTYIENLTSEETTVFIEKHLSSCKNCEQIYLNMKKDLDNQNIEDTEIVNEIKEYKRKINLIKTIFWIIVIGIILTIVISISYKFYVIRKTYYRNTNYRKFESFRVEEYDGSVECDLPHYTTYYLKNVMKKYYGDDVIEYYDGENHYYFDNENKTYWVKKENLNLSLNINISTMSGTENIIKNGKISNFEILKFIINSNIKVNTRTFRQKKYFQLYYEGDLIFIDADTFFVERVQDQKEKFGSEITKEYRVTTANVGWKEVEKPDLSKYTLIEKE